VVQKKAENVFNVQKPYDRIAQCVNYRRECEEVEVRTNRLKTVWIASSRSAHYVLIVLQTAHSLLQRYVM